MELSTQNVYLAMIILLESFVYIQENWKDPLQVSITL